LPSWASTPPPTIFDGWAFLGVGEIEADDLRGFCRRGVVKLEHRSAGRLEESITRAQQSRLFAFRLESEAALSYHAHSGHRMAVESSGLPGREPNACALHQANRRIRRRQCLFQQGLALKRASTTFISDLNAWETRQGRDRFSVKRGSGRF
jgi:hypothetical protein